MLAFATSVELIYIKPHWARVLQTSPDALSQIEAERRADSLAATYGGDALFAALAELKFAQHLHEKPRIEVCEVVCGLLVPLFQADWL